MTDIITVDFETYYDKEYSLSKLTTEEYIRDPRFQVIGVGVKVNNGPTEWASGTHDQLHGYFQEFDWDNSLVLAHNTMFDGAILSWIFDITPKAWLDTLCMARARHGVEVGGSLKRLAERYELGAKGTEVIHALGKRRGDFTPDELSRYGDYCINDVELTYKLFHKLSVGFPKKELKVIDNTLRMFTHPALELDRPLLEQHLQDIKDRKEALLTGSGLDRETLMSNPKFADALREHGVEPPTKISKTTDKETYAFAKTDEAFLALKEHPLIAVQCLVEARLGTKSTLEETRTERFLGIESRGLMPVPIRYYAAHTGRWGGDDKVNMQNLPSRGPDAKTLKRSIKAPEGYILFDCDSSQIEARVLAWLAGQNDLVSAFTNKEDVYVKMASSIYGVPEDEVTDDQRFVGKTAILGCGYGMGALRFRDQLKTFGVDVSIEESQRIIRVYRDTNREIVVLWRTAGNVLAGFLSNTHVPIDQHGLLKMDMEQQGIVMPSGLLIRYDDLQVEDGDKGPQYTYQTRRGRSKIYGGKCIENWTQGIARCIIAEQMLEISKRYRAVITVHDSLVCLVPEHEALEGKEYIEDCMRMVPDWAPGLPIDCEGFGAVRYGDCDKKSPARII